MDPACCLSPETFYKSAVLQVGKMFEHIPDVRFPCLIERRTEGSVLNEVRLYAVPSPFAQDAVNTLAFAFPSLEKILVNREELLPCSAKKKSGL